MIFLEVLRCRHGYNFFKSTVKLKSYTFLVLIVPYLKGENKMIIAFTGAHSTGKTTLLDNLREEPILKGYTFKTEITRSLQKKGLSINEEGNSQTQGEIMRSHLNTLKINNVLMDRCFLDGIVYTKYLHETGNVSDFCLNQSTVLFQDNINRYDLLFYFIPELKLEDDKIRSISISFHSRIVQLFNEYISMYQLKVIPVLGSIEERKKIVLKHIGEYK